MKTLFSLLFIVCSLSLLAQPDIINDKNAEVRQVSGYSAIKVSGGIDLYLSQGSEAVAVSASEEKYRSYIKTEVKNGVLEIYYDDDRKGENRKHERNGGDKKLKAYVSFKTLHRLNASGASDVRVSGTINVNSLKMDLSGASDFKGSVKIQDLQLEMSGASDVDIDGTVTNLKIDASGASDLDGYGLITESCVVEATGASDIRLTVSRTLSAKASGASSVHYRGNATVDKAEAHGASSVKKA
jgi:hypothetical protein